jgi:hypothetical protein
MLVETCPPKPRGEKSAPTAILEKGAGGLCLVDLRDGKVPPKAEGSGATKVRTCGSLGLELEKASARELVPGVAVALGVPCVAARTGKADEARISRIPAARERRGRERE